MHDVRAHFLEHLVDLVEISASIEALVHLARHQDLGVAEGGQFRVRQADDLGGMIVRNLAAADNRHFQHERALLKYAKYAFEPSEKDTAGVHPSWSFNLRFEYRLPFQ